MGLAETEILIDILRHFATREELRLWRAHTGAAITPVGGRIVRFGVPGQADLSGIVRVAPARGRRLEIEVKTTVGRQSELQKNYQRMITDAGGIYILAKSVNDVYAGLGDAGIDLSLLMTGGAQ